MRPLVEVCDRSGLEEEKGKSGTIMTRKTVQVEVCGAISWVSLEILILKVQQRKMKTRTNNEKKEVDSRYGAR